VVTGYALAFGSLLLVGGRIGAVQAGAGDARRGRNPRSPNRSLPPADTRPIVIRLKQLTTTPTRWSTSPMPLLANAPPWMIGQVGCAGRPIMRIATR